MCEVAKKPTFAVVHVVLVLVRAHNGPLLNDAGWMVLSIPPSAVHARPYLQRQLHLQRPWPVSSCSHAEATSRARFRVTCSLGLSDRPAPAHALKNIHSTDLLPPEEDTSWQYHVKAGLRKGTSEMGRISWLVMVSMPASPLTLALAMAMSRWSTICSSFSSACCAVWLIGPPPPITRLPAPEKTDCHVSCAKG